MRVELTVNGVLRSVDVEPMARLIDILRRDLRLTGTKEGCGEGECGACSVIMDGKLVTSCLVPAIQADGSEITTIEGIGTAENPSELQVIFNEAGAIQCGFCTPGMITAAHDLLSRNPEPDRQTVRWELSGNICRCTGYEKIYDAVARAAKAGYGIGRKASANPRKSKRTLKEVLEELKRNPEALILAGATDILVDMRDGRKYDNVVDIFGLPELHSIYRDGEYVHIGSCVTNDELENDPLVKEFLPALSFCASRCGGPAIQNRATIGGNICTASGAGDLQVVLLALSASVLLASADGLERTTLEDFVTGYRRTALKPGQILKEILVPVPAPGSTQAFFKRGSRKALTLSRVSLAVYIELDKGRVTKIRLATGSMSPTPVRLKKTESAIVAGEVFDAAFIDRICALASEETSPRKQTAYRKNITGNLLRRFLEGIRTNPA